MTSGGLRRAILADDQIDRGLRLADDLMPAGDQLVGERRRPAGHHHHGAVVGGPAPHGRVLEPPSKRRPGQPAKEQSI